MKKLANTAIMVFVLMILSKALGFFREMCLAYGFGTSNIVDAYTICITLPSVICSIFISGFSQSYIPVFSRLENDTKKNSFFSNTINILAIASVVVTILCYFGSPVIARILAPGFDDATIDITIRFLRVIVWILPFMTIFNILCADLSAKENFLPAYFCDFIVINIAVIISILVAKNTSPMWLPIGYVGAQVVACIILIIYYIKKSQTRYTAYINIKDTYWNDLSKLAIPFGLSLFANQINSVADRFFASTLGEGIISSLNYANKVQAIILTLTTSIFLSVCYPRINQHFAAEDYESGMHYIKKGFLLACYTSVPMTIVMVLGATPIVKLLFERGMFNSNSTETTAICLTFYAIGIPFYAFREILSRALAANKQQKLILKNTLLTVIFNIVFNIIMINFWGYMGLALATSLAGGVACFLMFIDLKKMNLKLWDLSEKKDVFKICVISILSGVLMKIIYTIMNPICGNSIAIIGALAVWALIYLVLSRIFNIGIYEWVLSKLSISRRH